MPKVNLEQKISAFNDHNVMVVKAKGEFVWHAHPDTDDFSLS